MIKITHWLSFILLLAIHGQAYALDPVPDVRTVIDVSGSMKNNDPANLRAPALKLLVELLPAGTRAGVWTFGQYVNMNVKHGEVDASWKEQARAEAASIHSRGLYTNIEDALRKASFGWRTPDPSAQRNLILLTDGVVDISEDEQVNAQSRQRIIEELLPRLKKARARVHTVALSKDADHELLKQISSLTGGWYERVDNAAQLQKVFLRLFEKSTPVDTLPIKANKFDVDKQVSDMTLVLFHSKEGHTAKIITPDNETISQAKHDQDVRWHQEQGYELVTIKKPLAGQWQLQTEADPDNRVMVVTNLRLKVATLPNSLLAGDELPIKAHLAEDGKKITRSDFLSLVDFNLIQDKRQGDTFTAELRDDGLPPDDLKQDGVYTTQLGNSLTPGQHMLSVQVGGPTFKREFRHLVQVYDTAAEFEIRPAGENDFNLVLTPRSDILQLSTVSAQVTLPDGKVSTFTQGENNEWLATVSAAYQGKDVTITLIGTRMDDKPLKLEFEEKLSLTDSKQAIAMSEQKQQVAEEQSGAQQQAEQASSEQEADDKASKPAAGEKNSELEKQENDEDEVNLVFIMSMTLVINVILIIAGFIAYKIWKKRSNARDTEEENEMVL
ncbi:MAG: VWA domain-containing protein [Thioalkalispiraceae bacterium]|jgi:uncharacterized protein (TIGR03503 family)